MHLPIDSTTNYPTFYTVGLYCQTPTLTPACQAEREFVLFFDGLWYDLAGVWAYDLPHERRTRLPLSHPEAVLIKVPWQTIARLCTKGLKNKIHYKFELSVIFNLKIGVCHFLINRFWNNKVFYYLIIFLFKCGLISSPSTPPPLICTLLFSVCFIIGCYCLK